MNDTLQKLLKEEDNARARGIDVDIMRTKNSAQKSEPETKITASELRKSRQQNQDGNITKTQPPPMQDVSDGERKTVSEQTPPKENGCANSVSAEASNQSGTESAIRNPPSVLLEPSTNVTAPSSEIIASQSMSLLDESANHMFGLMKGLQANQPPAEIRAFDPERVNSAVACANTIYKIMRLKLDAIKVQRKIK